MVNLVRPNTLAIRALNVLSFVNVGTAAKNGTRSQVCRWCRGLLQSRFLQFSSGKVWRMRKRNVDLFVKAKKQIRLERAIKFCIVLALLAVQAFSLFIGAFDGPYTEDFVAGLVVGGGLFLACGFRDRPRGRLRRIVAHEINEDAGALRHLSAL